MDEDVAGRCAEDVTKLVEDLFAAILPSEETFAVLMDLVERRIETALAGPRPASRRPAARAATSAAP